MPATKNLEILYFASLAEQAGKDEEKFSFDGDNLPELYQTLSEQYGFSLAQAKLAVAINHEITDWNAPIHDGDIIAFIPPVAGG
ncbi:molybdopterin converting factor subunit 1 [Faucicola mancuniensis]|uniref:molybdopterin converting factor subunit 1 n=1 Tax=Faucicola mancuniensis TaxID=1309795 RepID=UPI003977AC97